MHGLDFANGTAPAHTATIPIEMDTVVDILTAIVVAIILLVLVAPIIEIAVKRPRIFCEITEDTRAFAEAPVPEDPAKRSPAEGRQDAVVPQHDDRLAGLTS
jgi:hypothetical protein